jgi:hypothetical protein
MRAALTGSPMHHKWSFYVTVVLLAVALLLLCQGDVPQSSALFP